MAAANTRRLLVAPAGARVWTGTLELTTSRGLRHRARNLPSRSALLCARWPATFGAPECATRGDGESSQERNSLPRKDLAQRSRMNPELSVVLPCYRSAKLA